MVMLTLKKDKILTAPNDVYTCWHLQKTSDRQVDDQFSPISKGQGNNLDSTDPASRQWTRIVSKQTSAGLNMLALSITWAQRDSLAWEAKITRLRLEAI